MTNLAARNPQKASHQPPAEESQPPAGENPRHLPGCQSRGRVLRLDITALNAARRARAVEQCLPAAWVPRMRAADLIVCERRDRLTHSLRSALLRLGVDRAELTGRKSWLRQRSAAPAVRSLLAERPASLVVLEVTSQNLKDMLSLLHSLAERWPAARAVAVVDDQTAECRLGLREAGAIHIAQDVFEISAVAEMALRHFSRQPQPRRTLKEELWARLPWPA